MPSDRGSNIISIFTNKMLCETVSKSWVDENLAHLQFSHIQQVTVSLQRKKHDHPVVFLYQRCHQQTVWFYDYYIHHACFFSLLWVAKNKPIVFCQVSPWGSAANSDYSPHCIVLFLRIGQATSHGCHSNAM